MPCPAGTVRDVQMLKCTPCPAGSAQSNTGQHVCELCIGSYTRTAGQANCKYCDWGTIPTPVQIETDSAGNEFFVGSKSCEDCPLDATPPSNFTWQPDFRWHCSAGGPPPTQPLCSAARSETLKPRKTLPCCAGCYQDRRRNACPSCEVPCTVPGQYRPYCGPNRRGLPACLPCANDPGDGGEFTAAVIMTTDGPAPDCPFQCLPGFTLTLPCDACTPCNPALVDGQNREFVDNQCNTQCAVGFREPTPGSQPPAFPIR